MRHRMHPAARRLTFGVLAVAAAALAACHDGGRTPTGFDRLSLTGDSSASTGTLAVVVREFRVRNGPPGDTLDISGAAGVKVEVFAVPCPIDTVPPDTIPNDTIPNDTLPNDSTLARRGGGSMAARDSGGGGNPHGASIRGTTNASGELQFDLPPGCYIVQISRPGNASASVWLAQARVVSGQHTTVSFLIPAR